MAIRVFLTLLLFLSLTNLASSIYEDQVGLMDWHQQYIGKVKHAVFHTQKTGRKRVLVSTEENVVASLDLRHGEIFWRHVLGTNDVVDGIDIALGKYVITLSSGGSILRAWNLPDGQMVWESSLQGSKESKSILNIPKNLKADKDDLVLVYGKGYLHAISGIDGEILWRKDFAGESIEVNHIIQSPEVIYVAGFVGSSKFYVYELNAKNGELLKNNHITLPFGTSGESLSVPDLVKDLSGQAVILPSRLPGLFALKINSHVLFIKVTAEGELVLVDKIDNAAAFSNALSISENQHVFAFVQYEDNKIHLSVKDVNDWNGDLLKEDLVVDYQRGNIEKIFINNYVRTDRSHGFRALMVMEDHSLLLVQQGEIVWSREDGLASVVDVTTSELPVEKDGVSVAKVEQNLFEWLKGHVLKLKGTLMIASPEDKVAIQKLRLRSSEKSKMTRDHNGFRKLLIVLTRAGKVFALHTGDGHVPHHHALDENPSILVIGRCAPSLSAPTVLSFLDAYTGKELNSLSLAHTVARVIPLPYTDSTEQRLHLIIDINKHAYLYPRTPEAIEILKLDEYCFVSRDLWSIVFPSESEKIIATVTRKSNEVVHTQAKVMTDHDVLYKYISKNILFVANAAPKASGEIGTATPEEASLVIYIIDTVTGRILHRMTHHGCQGPVHAVFSENWVVYHYFNLRAHRHEMSVIEVYDQSRADNKDIWKFVLGKHNLTSPISSYYRPEISAKSQSYFFTHSVKAIEVTSTAKGITSKQLLIGTIGDQVLALDKRFLDPRRTLNPSQAEKEEGIIPLTDSLPIISQSYITHSLKVGGLRGILTVPAKLESTSLVFAYGVDLFFTQIAPSRTYDSLTEDFSYALLLLTIVALVAALFVTWILSERKDLQEKWR
ncbi:unnamed protein product [Vicia faba]|uniref:ER membrane protein complex subunit 1 n=1 Tax=Vicia faba TaxID=3906 RepID=A0AAV0ZSG9_VICFA|nr:unnamed protein product [Vicia faba]